ncbi:hypothetical protein F4678DRAFT_425530 [Xylaria arbuscula]|nr:hypothetical protein F4678DRAFT_425530 [Xylaria arbuscula]
MSSYLSHLFARSGQEIRGNSEKRAEFNFVTDGKDFKFYTLVQGSYNSIQSEYMPIKDSKWLRSEWKVGIAVNRFDVPRPFQQDRLGHWGVYLTRADSTPLPAPYDVPENIFKIYGMNWAPQGESLQLEAIWGDDHEARRDFKREDVQAIEDSTAGKSVFGQSHFGVYEETFLYFSWPEFILVAQFLLHEFVFAALSIPPEDRPQHRATNPNLRHSAKAYSLLSHNCQDFSRLLINKMKEHVWERQDRLFEAFTLDGLVQEWKKKDNSWVWRDGFSQHLITSSFLDISPTLNVDDWTEFISMEPSRAQTLWTNLQKRQKSVRPSLRHDPALTALLARLNHIPLTIELAAAYVNSNQMSITQYINVLDVTDGKTKMLTDRTSDVFRMFQKRARHIRGVVDDLDGVALTWLASMDKIKDTPGRVLRPSPMPRAQGPK